MRTKSRVTVALFSFLLVGLTAGVYFLPRLQVRHAQVPPEDVFEAENSARDSLVRLLATLAVLGGFYLAWRRTTATERRVFVLEESHVTDRFTRAVDQLSSDQAAVRLGGIFALERIAHESPRDIDAIVSTLCAYVRTRAPWPEHSADPNLQTPRPEVDIQSALDVISGRRGSLSPCRTAKIDLSYSDLRGANLAEAELNGAILRSANLEHANLWRANLRGAILWRARLGDTNFRKAFLDDADTTQTIYDGDDDPKRALRAAAGEADRIAGVILDTSGVSSAS